MRERGRRRHLYACHLELQVEARRSRCRLGRRGSRWRRLRLLRKSGSLWGLRLCVFVGGSHGGFGFRLDQRPKESPPAVWVGHGCPTTLWRKPYHYETKALPVRLPFSSRLLPRFVFSLPRRHPPSHFHPCKLPDWSR